ncbi:phage/plasmid primase, P4 family [Azospirillum sp. TSO22-1]|uniref:DNA primase family protein n=1 Tax=Azospirillum sp. TSO22-1 TaxID=716789 RepID=UPI0011B773A9|nr:phage/plasmid primase, P4 family [Azospirillum sp. TSO22-1]
MTPAIDIENETGQAVLQEAGQGAGNVSVTSTDVVERSAGPERSDYAGLLEIASNLGKGDFPGTIVVIRKAVEAKLSGGERAMLRNAIKSATELPVDVIKAVENDALNYHPEYGCLNSADDVTAAFLKLLSAIYHIVLWTEGRFYSYVHGNAGAPYYEAHTYDELKADILGAFVGMPCVQSERDRKEVANRICAACAREDYFADAPAGINLGNGFLRQNAVLGNVELLPHAPENKARFLLDVRYDPDARAPTFLSGLRRLLGGDGRKVRVVLQFMACILFGSMPARDRVRTVMVLYGPPRSGKSTLIELMSRFVPAHARASVPPEQWSQEYQRAMLCGVRLNTVTELSSAGRAISGAVFKQIASREPVVARQIYGKPFTFTPQAAHVFGCNELPKLSETNDSLERRFIVVTFAESLGREEVDPDFLERVWEEAPGIINLLVEEARAMHRDGAFTLPDDHEEQVVQMQHGPDPAAQVARLWVEAASDERITSRELQAALRAAGRRLGLDTTDWSSASHMRKVADLLKARYRVTRHMVDGAPFYKGIRFRDGFAVLTADEMNAGEAAGEVEGL